MLRGGACNCWDTVVTSEDYVNVPITWTRLKTYCMTSTSRKTMKRDGVPPPHPGNFDGSPIWKQVCGSLSKGFTKKSKVCRSQKLLMLQHSRVPWSWIRMSPRRHNLNRRSSHPLKLRGSFLRHSSTNHLGPFSSRHRGKIFSHCPPLIIDVTMSFAGQEIGFASSTERRATMPKNVRWLAQTPGPRLRRHLWRQQCKKLFRRHVLSTNSCRSRRCRCCRYWYSYTKFCSF